MNKTKTIPQKYYRRFFLLVSSASLWLSPIAFYSVQAQQEEQPTPQTTEPTTAQPARRRLRPTFFEEERRLRLFGFGDFLQSALDGVDNVFPDPVGFANVSPSFIAPIGSPIDGTVTVQSRNEFSNNFLETDFVSPAGNLTFRNVIQGADPRQGTLTVSGTLNVDGQPISFNNQRATYNAGFSDRGNLVSGVILVTDPSNPQRSVFIQIPVQTIPGFENIPDTQPVTGQGNISIGRPTDR